MSLVPLAMATLLGLYLCLVDTFLDSNSKEVLAPTSVLLCCVVFIANLCWQQQHWKRIAQGILLFIFLSLIPILWIYGQLPNADEAFRGDKFRLLTFTFALIIASHIYLPFLQIKSQQETISYARLFNLSWNNTFIALLAIGFLLCIIIILFMWGMLFKTINIRFFSKLFSDSGFIYLSYPIFLSTGIYLVRTYAAILNSFKRISFSLAKIFIILISSISLLFVFSLLFTGMQPLWDTRYAANILLAFLLAKLVLINAIYQDGEQNMKAWLKYTNLLSIFLMPIFCILVFTGIGLRIGQHGLTPDRFYVVLFTIVFSCYAMVYMVAPFSKSYLRWSLIAKGNIALSFVLFFLSLLIHTPILDPLSWSAYHQYQRFLSKQVKIEQFDYSYLYHKLGRQGNNYLEKIKNLEHPQKETITNNIKKVKTENYYTRHREIKPISLDNNHFDNRSRYRPIPSSLLASINSIRSWEYKSCHAKSNCLLLESNLDQDPFLEILFVAQSYVYIFDSKDGGNNWSRTARSDYINAKTAKALRKNHFKVIEPKYQDLKANKQRIRIKASR